MKNEHTITAYNNKDEFHQHTIEQKKPNIKAHILYFSIYIKFKNRQSYYYYSDWN